MNKNEILSYIFYPRESFSVRDEKDILVNVEAGVDVGIRLFLKDRNLPTIIYFHGNAELSQEYDSIAEIYNDYDMNIIVADYRGYGLSGGYPNKDNLHSDSIKIFDYIKFYLKDNKYIGDVIVMGRSLGSASACEIIFKREDDISKCIIESGFGTEYPLFNLLGVNPNSLDFSIKDGFMNLEKIKKYKKPIYFIHSDHDHIVPLSEAELMLSKSTSKEKDLYIVRNANHNNIIMTAKDIYFQKIKDFIYNESS